MALYRRIEDQFDGIHFLSFSETTHTVASSRLIPSIMSCRGI